MMIDLINISKKYNDNYVLKDINILFPKRGLVIIAGESGSGKTTLLNIIGGIISPDEGSINILGTDQSHLNDRELDAFRIKNIGYVFQSFNLLQLETVFDNVKMPLQSISNCNAFQTNKRVDDVLKEVGVFHLKKKTVNKLSGGEKQRVAIAKALVTGPGIILCDEPTGALDKENTKSICELLKRVSQRSLVVVVTHDLVSFQEYADRIIHIKDGNVYKDEVFESSKKPDKELLILGNSKFQKKPRLPLSFKIKHAIHKINEKKYRFMISNFMLSLSFVGIGLSIIISTSLGQRIQSSFSTLLNGNQILVTSRNQSLNDFGAIFSASEFDVKEIVKEYPEYIDDYGVTYLVNFENFFKDKNVVSLSDNKYLYPIPSLSARSFNDYVWIDDLVQSKVAPELISPLENDEVVMGLSYSDMVNLTYNLKIKRNFESLSNYIYHNDIHIVLHVRNSAWQYEDEQMFLLKGVFEADSTHLYHTSHHWNKEIFEDEMRFPSNDGSGSIFPWEMQKIHFINVKEDVASFQNAVLYDDRFHDYIFERTSYEVHPLICKKGEVCKSNRLLVYNVDKNTFYTGALLNIVRNKKDFKYYFFLSSGGYVSYGSMLLSGFRNNTFFSISKDKIDIVVDADSKRTDESLQVDLPRGVLKGNFMESLGESVKFSSKIDRLISGRLPENNKEIVISKAMADALDNGYDVLNSYLYISSNIDVASGEEGKIYSTSRVKIVGINNSSKYYVYHNGDWTISFFRDELGMSSFNLCPNSLVIELDDNVDPTSTINKLNKTYYDYVFSSPIEEISKSINQTLDFIKIIVILFSVLAGSISILLLVTLLLLNILENEHEVKIFKFSGISNKDINSQFVVDSLIQSVSAFVVSMLELTLTDFLMGKAIDDMLGVSSGFSLNPTPILLTFAIGIGTTYIVSKVIVSFKTLLIKKKRK